MDTNNEVITPGIVLYEARFKNSSKVIEILTRDLGKISVAVLGAYRPNSGVLMATSKLVESNYILTKSRENYYIKSAKVIEDNLELSKSPKRYLVSEIILEIIRKSSFIKMREENVFELVEATLKILKDEKINPDLVKAGFMIKYISLIGFRPVLDKCVFTNSHDYKNMYFSISEGGLVHAKALENKIEARKITVDEIEFLKKLLYFKYIDYINIAINDKILHNISILVRDYLLYYTEIDYLSYEIKYQKLSDLGGK